MIYYHCFLWVMIITLINITRTKTSLLSRFRNPNEYVPRDEKYFFAEDMDDDMYADLLEEVPELVGKLRRKHDDMEENTMLPFIRNDFNEKYEEIKNIEEFDTARDEDQEEYPGQLDYMTVTDDSKNISASNHQLPFLTPSSQNLNELWEKRKNLTPEKFLFFGPTNWKGQYIRVARCYWCGMNHSTKIPLSPLCHDAFESPDWRARTLARYFRAHCFYDWFYTENIKVLYWSKWTTYRYDNGLIRQKFGPYTKGCFKRFLDVGKVYTQRGCRSHWPKYTETPNFANHRFTRLERLIKKEKDYCIVSPHASLTPFSRAISLYVRYHVCVCEGKYCNHAHRLQYTYYSLPLITLIFLVLPL